MSARKLLALAAGLLVALVPVVAHVPAAAQATMYGHDVAWPQCPAPGGFGNPMPPEDTEFVIIGVNGAPATAPRQGLAFIENPCLSSQVSWATSRNKPTHAYTMATFPTSAQLSTYGGSGPWRTTTRAGRLSNVGYAEAQFALASMERVGWSPPVVWIDVEPRTAQPWPSSTTAQKLENRYIVEGLMRALRDAGKSYGLYSYTNGWQEIVGSWRLPGVPVWATAGQLDYPNEALDRCTQPSFSAGRVYISQWYDDTRDYDLTCSPYTFTPLAIPPSSLSNSTNEFDGDWRNDVVARETATGYLWLYRGNGTGGWLPRVRIGTGWQGMNLIETVGDFNGDGKLDVIARQASTGDLLLYRGNGKGGWLGSVRIGTGWQSMNVIFGPGDFNGDGRVDVLARQTSTGDLLLYRGNGTGGWLSRVRVGTGWQGMNAIFGPGDFNGDGRVDVLARRASTGELMLYPGNGSGGWLTPVRVGTGWQGMNAIFGPGDFNGDRTADVLARRASSGELALYPGNGTGGWLSPVVVGTGWQSINSLS
jgi:hypothetical protein